MSRLIATLEPLARLRHDQAVVMDFRQETLFVFARVFEDDFRRGVQEEDRLEIILKLNARRRSHLNEGISRLATAEDRPGAEAMDRLGQWPAAL